MKPLLSDRQLAAMQNVGRTGMRVKVIIRRPTYAPGVLGDGERSLVAAAVTQPSKVLVNGNLLGYLRQTGGDVTGGVDISRIQTTSTFQLGLPIGTDVRTRDQAVINGEVYAIQNVLDVETWPAMLDCVLRLGS